MKTLRRIIVAEIKRNYNYESDFYEKVLGISQQSWNKWKKGDQEFKEKHMIHIKALFTDYEWMIVNKVSSQMDMYPNNFKKKTYDEYKATKLHIATDWVKDDSKIEVNSARNVDDPNSGRTSAGTEIKVTRDYGSWKDVLTFNVNVSSAHIKAGKENRKKWFLENMEKEIV